MVLEASGSDSIQIQASPSNTANINTVVNVPHEEEILLEQPVGEGSFHVDSSSSSFQQRKTYFTWWRVWITFLSIKLTIFTVICTHTVILDWYTRIYYILLFLINNSQFRYV